MKRTWQYYSIAVVVTIVSLTSYKLASGLAEKAAPPQNPETNLSSIPAPIVFTSVYPALASVAPAPAAPEKKSFKDKVKDKLKPLAKKRELKKNRVALKQRIADQAEKQFQHTSEVAHNLVNLGLSKIGSPYVWGGTSENGFDCSGFVTYVFRKFEIEVPRSSVLQANAGRPIPRSKAKPGDILIFTGTNSRIRKPGHVGIVISKPGETLQFVHASSVGGVKISQVENTNYEKRFLGVRRVL